jgi:hypothetical protein
MVLKAAPTHSEVSIEGLLLARPRATARLSRRSALRLLGTAALGVVLTGVESPPTASTTAAEPIPLMLKLLYPELATQDQLRQTIWWTLYRLLRANWW